MKKTILLMILDGFGYRKEKEGNAILKASLPYLNHLLTDYPHTLIHTSGLAVGLPEGQMGNSEVGHTNIGAGRIVYQDLVKINQDIVSGKFYQNQELNQAISHCQQNNSNLHLFGLLSDGGVHSQISHLFAILDLCKQRNFSHVYIHCFMDGRDTDPTSGFKYVEMLENKINSVGIGTIASVMGRFYAMDRDKRWDRVAKAYQTIVKRDAPIYENALKGIEASYQNKITDEFIEPFITTNGEALKANDAVIFYNYRHDRARELTRAIVDNDFNEFPVKKMNVYYVCMTEYDKTLPNVHIAYPPLNLVNTLGEYISKKGMRQLRIAETEKYAHVTFFFNGGREDKYPLEDRILIPSPKVQTYDLKPEMSAYEVTKKVISAIETNQYDLIILNFANPDMVGHTGNMSAAIKALEALDICIKNIVTSLEKYHGVLLLTADHGNCEEMLTKDLKPMTSHTTNPVPLVLKGIDKVRLQEGKLCDLAPTILDLLNLEKPQEMTGSSLIIKQ